MTINKYGSDKQSFVWPCLLANGPNGEVIVGNNADSVKHLVVFDEKLNTDCPQVIGEEGNEDGKFQCISGIAVDKDGFVYASDFKLHRIQKFTLEGEFVSKFGTKGIGNGEFNEPFGLTFSRCNLLFICDRQNHRIQVFQVFQDEHKYFYKFGQFSNEGVPGTFNQPVDLTLNNKEDKLFVTDWSNDRVQVFEPNGQYLTKIENGPDIPFNLKGPDGIFFTPDNHLLVSSTNCVLIFKEDYGSFVAAIKGKHDGIRMFDDCIGVVMMRNGKIVVADGLDGTNRLIVF